MIPKIMHFIWLTSPNGARQFNMHHMASVKSAHFFNPDFKINFHCDQVPTGPYFDEIRPLVELRTVTAPEEVFGNPLRHMIHKADVTRIGLLYEEGGVYQDLDIITMRSYADLLDNKLVMGIELSEKLRPRQIFYFLRTLNFDVIKYKFRAVVGLCDAFIMAEKNSPFMHDWYEKYRNFTDDSWSYFCIKVPYLLSQTGKYDIHIISPYQSHFPPCWPEDLKTIFEKNDVVEGKYFVHTWESRSYEKYLKPLTKEIIMKSNNTYCNAMKPFV